MPIVQRVINKLNNAIFTFRFCILSIFTTLFIVSMLLIIAINYFKSFKSMTYVSTRLMAETSSSVYDKIISEIQDVQNETVYNANLIGSNAINNRDLTDILTTTYSLVKIKSKTLPSIRSVAWADELGNFVQSHQQLDGSSSSNIIDQMHRPITSTIIDRTPDNKITTTVYTKNIDFDPRLRFWYTNAKNTKQTQISDLYQYIYYNVKYWGITISSPAFNKEGKFVGIFAIQMGINFIKHFIENLKHSTNGQIFIVTDNGNLVAFPQLNQFDKEELTNIHDLPYPWIYKSFDLYKSNKVKEFAFYYRNEKYIAIYNAIPSIGSSSWMVGHVAPESDFTAELIKANYITIGSGLLILILGIVIFSALITRIVKPLNLLTKETEYIKNFELQNDIMIKSNIIEVKSLTKALSTMKKGLRSFQKYVPANLVRQIIDAGEDANIGGAKKELVVLFSDIKNFTTLVEHMDPENLMSHLCEYFNMLSQIISNEKGTIDKYIGDSIMAFWGAPLIEEKPAHHAAKAALRCLDKVNNLNQKWILNNKPAFVTRFGIHIGDAVVGNIGSTERLNYTAIGDAINTTSRLEGINKIYGTNIIVSEFIYQKIKDDFVLRLVDFIALKGKTNTSYIYELIAEKGTHINYDIEKYESHFKTAFQNYQNQNWDEAIHEFGICLFIDPENTIASIFIERCQAYKLTPPDKDWDGSYHPDIK